MGKMLLYIISIALILLVVCAAWPYWHRYLINSDIETAAIYGTKHSVEDTRSYLSKKIKERGYTIDPESLYIEKDEDKSVSISLTYQDQISFFGYVLKELEFTLDVTEKNVKEFL